MMAFSRSLILTAFMIACIPALAGQESSFDKLTAEGDVAFMLGRFSDAERDYLHAIEASNHSSERPSRQAVVLNSLANIYNMEGHYADAEALCLKAVVLVEATSGKTDPAMADILHTLGNTSLHIGMYSKAQRLIQQAITIRKENNDNNEAELLADYTLLGVALCSQNRCKQARRIVQQALSLCPSTSLDCPGAAKATLGAIALRQGRYVEAEEWYLQALGLLEKAFGPSNPALVPILSDLSSLYASRKRFSEAEAYGRRSLEIAAKELSDSLAAANAALAVGQGLAGKGAFEAAEPYFKQFLSIHERARGKESMGYALGLRQYAHFLKDAKRSSEATEIEGRANELLNKIHQTVDVSELPRKK